MGSVEARRCSRYVLYPEVVELTGKRALITEGTHIPRGLPDAFLCSIDGNIQN
jgi:hypothetical protein